MFWISQRERIWHGWRLIFSQSHCRPNWTLKSALVTSMLRYNLAFPSLFIAPTVEVLFITSNPAPMFPNVFIVSVLTLLPPVIALVGFGWRRSNILNSPWWSFSRKLVPWSHCHLLFPHHTAVAASTIPPPKIGPSAVQTSQKWPAMAFSVFPGSASFFASVYHWHPIGSHHTLRSYLFPPRKVISNNLIFSI